MRPQRETGSICLIAVWFFLSGKLIGFHKSFSHLKPIFQSRADKLEEA